MHSGRRDCPLFLIARYKSAVGNAGRWRVAMNTIMAFAGATHGFSEPCASWTSSLDILRGLRALARREGKITIALIDDEPSLPSATTVIHQFGSISRAYRLAGLVRLEGWPMRHGFPTRR